MPHVVVLPRYAPSHHDNKVPLLRQGFGKTVQDSILLRQSVNVRSAFNRGKKAALSVISISAELLKRLKLGFATTHHWHYDECWLVR